MTKALSLSRPWTTLVMAGLKTVENRTWSTPYRGPLIIHGAQSWDGHSADETAIGAARTAEEALAFNDLHLTDPDAHPTGYLGVVDLTRVCNGECFSCGPWAVKGCHHWKMADPRRFPEPVPGPGRLGLFVPSVEALAAVEQLGVNA